VTCKSTENEKGEVGVGGQSAIDKA